MIMNENIDLTKILDGCPKGTKLYSPLFGEVEFSGIVKEYVRPIIIRVQTQDEYNFSKEGYFFDYYQGEECLLFPSKEQRDWSKFEKFWNKPKIEKFDPKILQPFDKVLVRDRLFTDWQIDFFSHINDRKKLVGCNTYWHTGIPYNEETKHLIGTTNDCPEYYKWWEK